VIDFAPSTSSSSAARLFLSEDIQKRKKENDDDYHSSSPAFSPKTSFEGEGQCEGMVRQLGCDRLHHQARQMQQESRQMQLDEEEHFKRREAGKSDEGCAQMEQHARPDDDEEEHPQQKAMQNAATEEGLALKARLRRLQIYEGLQIYEALIPNGEYGFKLNGNYCSEARKSDEGCAYRYVEEIVSPSGDRRLSVPIQRGHR